MTEAKLVHELKLLRAELSRISLASKTIDGWIPRKALMQFLDIGDTRMAELEKTSNLVVSKIGKRKVYSEESIVAMLKTNIISK